MCFSFIGVSFLCLLQQAAFRFDRIERVCHLFSISTLFDNSSVNIDEMHRDFARVMDRVAKGEEVVITSAGSPVAKLVPFNRPAVPRVPGCWRGKVRIAADFDVLPPEVAAALRGDAP
ncbi:MAG: type II toxin-antitoxin system Phd/YefM family antitoxin [Deltaproteobacteria bacterium]|nr:type II toxin-antitoxin system Phd/YefM family antitoxin [Deltaproteobacteria bacterium]